MDARWLRSFVYAYVAIQSYYICIYVHIRTYMCVYTYMHLYTVCAYICMYVYVCVDVSGGEH